MRTTVTIDPDTERLLRDECRRTGKSFKRALNEAIRSALVRPAERIEVNPLFKAPFPPQLANANFNHLADAWDDEATLEEIRP